MKINVQGRDICMQTSVKLLGINIGSNLTFYDHVAKVCRKAAMQINIMKRLGKYLDFNVRLTIYGSFFLPKFNYCPLVYNSMYARNENTVEILNKRMLRVVSNDRLSTYSELLVKVKRTTMHCNRRKASAGPVFNVLHNLSPPLPRNLVTNNCLCMTCDIMICLSSHAFAQRSMTSNLSGSQTVEFPPLSYQGYRPLYVF